MSLAPFAGEWLRKPGVVRHTLTHLELEVRAYVAHFPLRPNGEGIWLLPQEFSSAALPTLMRKIIAHALGPKTAAPPR
jgi:A/G-specific adenine glycosylase